MLKNSYHNELSIIFVNYKSSRLLNYALKSLINQSFLDFRIFIVDNTSGNKEFNILNKFKEKYKSKLKIDVIKPGFNLGFAGGNNLAMQQIKSPYILLLNCDTELEPDTIEKSIKYLKKHKSIGILSPKILIFGNKKRIYYGGAKINPKSFRFINYNLWKTDNGNYNQIKETDYADGAALFTRNKLIDKVGIFDEIFFMLYEETDWCFRARKKGYKIIYFPEAIVYHKIDPNLTGISYKIREGSFFIYLNTRNKIIFTCKHFSVIDLIIFSFTHLLKTIIQEITLSIYLKKPIFILSLIRAVIMGFVIGIRRKTNRNCIKLMKKELNYLNQFEKYSRSTQR